MLAVALIGFTQPQVGMSVTRLDAPHTVGRLLGSPLPEQYTLAILALDEKISSSVYYVRHDHKRFPAGQVRVRFNLYNAQPVENVWMEWKVLYYNQDNYMIEETEWETTMLHAKVIATIRSNSIRPDVINYTLMIRSSPRTDPNLTKPLGYVQEYEEENIEKVRARQEKLIQAQTPVSLDAQDPAVNDSTVPQGRDQQSPASPEDTPTLAKSPDPTTDPADQLTAPADQPEDSIDGFIKSADRKVRAIDESVKNVKNLVTSTDNLMTKIRAIKTW